MIIIYVVGKYIHTHSIAFQVYQHFVVSSQLFEK